jgi:O-antigen/teichoic acid export membrane protein
MLVVLARAGSTAMVGEYAYALALTAPVFQLASLQLRAVQATDARRVYPYRAFVALRTITTALALAVAAAIAAFAARGWDAWLVVFWVAAAKSVEALSDNAYGLLQREERMDLIARSMVARGVLGLVALAGGVLLSSLRLGVALLCASWAVVYLLVDHRAASQIAAADGSAQVAAGKGQLLRLARTALPLGVVVLLLSLSTSIPRYVIEHAAGLSALGVFAALTYLLVAGTTVVGALGQAASPRLARLHASGDRPAFVRLTVRLVGIAAALGLAGTGIAAAAGRVILGMIYGSEYALASRSFTWVCFAATFSYSGSILGYALTASGAYRVQPVLCAAEAAVVLGASMLLVPSHGLDGAAWALVVAGITKTLLYGWTVHASIRALGVPAEVPVPAEVRAR